MKRPEKPKAFDPEERAYWDELKDYIHGNDAFVTSEPHTNVIRFECLPDSSLPQLLDARGFDVIGAGTGERLLPATTTETRGNRAYVNQQTVPTTVSIYYFQLFVDP